MSVDLTNARPGPRQCRAEGRDAWAPPRLATTPLELVERFLGSVQCLEDGGMDVGAGHDTTLPLHNRLVLHAGGVIREVAPPALRH